MNFTKDKPIRYLFFAVLISMLSLNPSFVSAQDVVTAEEIQESQQIRQRLIEQGLLESTSGIPEADLSTSESVIKYAEYTNDNLSVTTEGSRATDFNDDGTRFYVVGRESLSIVEYHLSSSWNIESADFERELDISSVMGSGAYDQKKPHGIYIRKSDGEKMWVLNRREIWEYTLSTPWNISTATQTGYKDLSSDIVRGHDIDFSPNGRILFVDDRTTGVVFQFELSSSWDVETASLDYAFDISGEQDEVRGTQFSPDGDRMFLMDTGRQEVLEYSVSNAFDLRSASYLGSYSVASQSSNPRGLTFKSDLSRFYVTDNTEDRIYQYRLAIVDAAKSSVSAENGKVIADGNASSRVTVTLRDQSGNRIGDRKVSLSANSSNVDIDAVNNTTNSSGEARFDVSSSTSETVTFSASSMGVNIDDSETVRFVTIDDEKSSVDVNREKVIANGTATGKIKVTARDEDGDRISDVQITLNSNSSNITIDANKKTTDSDGEAEFEVRNDKAETVRFTASSLGVTFNEEVTVRFVTLDAEESSVISNRNKVQANGKKIATIRVTAKDEDGDELEGVNISLIPNSDDTDIKEIQNPTNSDGEAEFEVSSTVAELVEFQAKGVGKTIDESASVRFIPIDPDESDMRISTQKVLANGSAEATITINARDEDGNPFGFTDISLQQEGGNSTITSVQKTTDEEGIAIFKVKNSKVQEITYSAKALGVTINETVTAKFVTVDAGQTDIEVAPEDVQANGNEESKIIVTTRDEDGDELQGARVQIEVLKGSVEIDNNSKLSNSDGKATFNVTSGRPQIAEFKATAEGINLSEDISIRFIPVAPVSLSASNVETRKFHANWEMVDGAESYLLSVSTDSSFNEIVEPFNQLDVGNITSYKVENVSPGTTYIYRVRATSSGLIGAKSKPIQTTTFPEVPEAAAASERNALKFTANWAEAAGARNYRLDVSRDPSFNNILAEYKNLNVGTETRFTVTNLEPGTSYFYRVRSVAGPRVSTSSNMVETSTLAISSEKSEISSDQLRVLANGNQPNELRIIVKSDEGILLEGLEVKLNQQQENSEIEAKQPVTDEDGVAIFSVTSTSAGTVNYTATTSGKNVGEISVEFLQNEGILRLGDNFPNPFSNSTILPLTVPRPMQVEIQVFNSLGVPVRTVLNEEMNEGYYEIPFQKNDLASGVYFYRLITEEGVKTRKMVLVK